MLRWAKRLAARSNLWMRALVASVLLAGLFAVSSVLTGEGLTLGSGYRTVAWSTDPRHGILIVVTIFVVRGLATIVTIAGGGVGGLFIPLAIQGALLGRVVGDVLGASTTSLFPLIGVAAFLGAGYRVPLAAVMFVAESTGRPGFVVLASSPPRSRSWPWAPARSRPTRWRRALDTWSVVSLCRSRPRCRPTSPPSPDATIAEFFTNHLLGTRQRSVPVVEGLTYRGMARMQDLERVPQGPVGHHTGADDHAQRWANWPTRLAAAGRDTGDASQRHRPPPGCGPFRSPGRGCHHEGHPQPRRDSGAGRGPATMSFSNDCNVDRLRQRWAGCLG